MTCAGVLLGITGQRPLATAVTMAGVHLVVQEAGRRLSTTALARRLNRATIKRREMRHLGELSASVVLAAAGVLLGFAGAPQLGAPFIVVGVELAVHAAAAFREDVADARAVRRSRAMQRAACASGPASMVQQRAL